MLLLVVVAVTVVATFNLNIVKVLSFYMRALEIKDGVKTATQALLKVEVDGDNVELTLGMENNEITLWDIENG